MTVNIPEGIIIVGGGYLGAMSALLFSQCKDIKVTLIEKQGRLGGLYNSAWSKGDFHFDYGSRVILATGVSELDELLFSILPDDEYPKSVTNLKEFSYQSGERREYSNCLDARTLPVEIFERGVKELLAITASDVEGAEFKNLEELALATYGPIFSEHLIQPAIEKLTGLPLAELDQDALVLHGIHRIIIADADESKQLKSQDAFNDSRIAYARYDDNASTLVKTYPRKAGLADFGQRIQKYLNDAPNVRLILDNSVAGIEHDGNKVLSLNLEDGGKLACDHLLWTIPSIFLARLLDVDFSKMKPPKFRNSVMAHYIFNGTINTDAYFMYNYDPSYKTFRISFYDNFTARPSQHRSATVEVFHDAPDPDLDMLRDEIFAELKAMDCISKDSKIVEANMQFQRNAMPNYASDFFSNQHKANQSVVGAHTNIHMLGRANGKHHSATLVHSANALYQKLTA